MRRNVKEVAKGWRWSEELDKENETAPSSDDTAYKAGGHELFQRERQLIFTDRCDYPFIKVVIYARLIFPEFLDRLPFVAEHDEIPDEVACRFAHGAVFAFPEEKTAKKPSI
jgi:hypothetical protein